jgi:hypothetical protein
MPAAAILGISGQSIWQHAIDHRQISGAEDVARAGAELAD